MIHSPISVTSILVSRFIINLRSVYLSGETPAIAGGALNLSKFSDLRFANSIVGNLGAPLGFAAEERRSMRSEGKGDGSQVANISDDPLMEFLPSGSDDTDSIAPRDPTQSVNDEEKAYPYYDSDDDDDDMSVSVVRPQDGM